MTPRCSSWSASSYKLGTCQSVSSLWKQIASFSFTPFSSSPFILLRFIPLLRPSLLGFKAFLSIRLFSFVSSFPLFFQPCLSSLFVS